MNDVTHTMDPHDFDTPSNLLRNPRSVLSILVGYLSNEDQASFMHGARHQTRFDENLFN